MIILIYPHIHTLNSSNKYINRIYILLYRYEHILLIKQWYDIYIDMKKDTLQNSSQSVSSAFPSHKKKKTLSPERVKEMVEKAKKSPRHGKHGKQKKTLLMEEVYKQVQQKLVERAMGLVDTQTIIAHGTIKVYKIVSHWEGSGKNKRKVRGKPELVTDTEEIAACIDYEYGDGESPNDDDEYFFVSTQDPDNKAIQAQLDRVFGKAPQTIDVTTKGNEIKSITGMQIIQVPDGNSI